MPTLHLEHAIKDFAMWKAAFDRDPIDRRSLGVRRYRITRPLDDPNYVIVDLDFDSSAEAEACRTALHGLWRTGTAAPALVGDPHITIVETVEDETY
jgi:hypothetical protein